jgi:hypothetical protein
MIISDPDIKSRIPDPTIKKRGRGEKLVVLPLFAAIHFKKIYIIYFFEQVQNNI